MSCLLAVDREREHDILPAKRLGLRTVWFRQGRYAALEPRVPDELPDATVTDLEALPSAIRSIAGRRHDMTRGWTVAALITAPRTAR